MCLLTGAWTVPQDDWAADDWAEDVSDSGKWLLCVYVC